MKEKKEKEEKEHSNLRIFIVCICVIMIWRAVWDFCELFIFPDNQILSDTICLVVGTVVLFLDDGRLHELK